MGFYLLVSAYLVGLAGFIMGANAGLAADSLDEATLDTEVEPITAEDLREQDTMRERFYESLLPVEPPEGPELGIQEFVNARVLTISNQLLTMSLSVANTSAVFFYQNQWIPAIVPQALSYLGLLPLFGFAGWHIWRVYKMSQ